MDLKMFDLLVDDLLRIIFESLYLTDLVKYRLVSKRWRKLINQRFHNPDMKIKLDDCGELVISAKNTKFRVFGFVDEYIKSIPFENCFWIFVINKFSKDKNNVFIYYDREGFMMTFGEFYFALPQGCSLEMNIKGNEINILEFLFLLLAITKKIPERNFPEDITLSAC